MASIIKLNRLISRFIPRIMIRPRIYPIRTLNRSMAKYWMYSGLVTSAFGVSYMLSSQRHTANATSGYVNYTDQTKQKNVNLLNSLRDLAPQIDAKKLLKLFRKEFLQEGRDHVTEQFVTELFDKCGIHDPEIAKNLFRLMDWNNNGKLEPVELAATFTLFQVGNETQRYKFLFMCLDLDMSRTVDKTEFRSFVTALLEAKYRLQGLKNYNEPDELYTDISYTEYRTIAKIKANTLVRDIFLFADQNRDGELDVKEFLHWCKRGGVQVA
eukprot:728045_1